MTDAPVVLKINQLNLSVKKDGKEVPILHDISLEIREGEQWAIAGESGAGKSMTMYALTSLLPAKSTVMSGEICYREPDGSYTDVLKLPAAARTVYCAGKVSLIFQDSINALNPFEKIGTQWRHTLKYRRPDLKKRYCSRVAQTATDFADASHSKSAKSAATTVSYGIFSSENAYPCTVTKKQQTEYMAARLAEFGIPDRGVLQKYPHQLSGGMKQRIAIAMALESDAKILIADEPTTSLDAVNQRKVVTFIQELCASRGLTLLYISHNLALLDEVCDHAAVVRNGTVVECGSAAQVFHDPEHPYTRSLIEETRKLAVTEGQVKT